jgi:heparan-alpha-glucosaminide N-acetyltransferase
MTFEIQENSPGASPRLRSLDVLRGLVVLVMLFVNDVAGVAGAPAWMKHISPSTADGMTFVDVVFPAFLFIVGLSLPLALERRLTGGDSGLSALRHVLARTGSLLVIGVLMVNTESPGSDGRLNPHVWALVMYAGVCLVWMSPGTGSRERPSLRVAAGGALLLALAFAYRGRGEPGLIELRPQWWGILGLIGWAYLVACVLYLTFRKRALAFAAAVPLLYCVYLAHGAGFFSALGAFNRLVSVGSALGSHAAVTASGVVLGLLLLDPGSTPRHRIRAAVLLGATLAVAAVLLHSLHGLSRMFIYNKNAATPPWCLLSSAYTAWLFAAAYWLVDVRGQGAGTGTLARAGQNALFAFVAGPIAYAALALLPAALGGLDPWGWLGARFATGLPRSVVFALAVTWVTAALQQRGRALRL